MKIVFLLFSIFVLSANAVKNNFQALDAKNALLFTFEKNEKEVGSMTTSQMYGLCTQKLKEYMGWQDSYIQKMGRSEQSRDLAMAGFLLTRGVLSREALRNRAKNSINLKNTFISELVVNYGEKTQVSSLQSMSEISLINLFSNKVEPSSAHPGLKARISQKAFDYFSDVGRKAMFRELNKLKIDDIHEKNTIVDVRAYDFKIVMPKLPQAHVVVHDWGLRWTVTDLTIFAQARMKVKGGLGPIKLPILSGSKVTGVTVGLGVTLDIGLGGTESGCATMEVRSCATTGSIVFNFQNKFVQIINKLLSGKLSGLLKNLICKQGIHQIDVLANKYMALMPTYAYHLGYTFDFGFLDQPKFLQHSFETIHKGIITYSGQDSVINHLPTTIPTEQTTDKMAYVYITDYAINAFLKAMFLKGDMHYTFDKKILPENFKSSLKMICLMIPEIDNDSDPIIGLKAVSAPTIRFKDELAYLDLETYFKIESSKDGVVKHAVTLILNINATLDADWSSSHVFFTVGELKATTSMYKNSIPNSGVFLQKLLQPTIMATRPMLNFIGRNGIKLPGHDKFKFSNSEIRIEEKYPGLMIVETDISVDL